MQPTRALSRKVIIVTGGGGAIGALTALRLAELGAIAVVVDRSEEAGGHAVEAIRENGGRGLLLTLDVSEPESAEEMVRKTVELCGQLDGAFNNLGNRGLMSSFVDTSEEDFDNLMRLNLKCTWLAMKAELRHMSRQGRGTIVNHSSVLAFRGNRFFSAYGAMKAGVMALTRSAAVEYAPRGIRVNAVSPGLIRTPDLDSTLRLNPDLEKELVRAHPMNRLGTPDEVANVVAWLFTDSAAFLSGQSIDIDGGMLAA